MALHLEIHSYPTPMDTHTLSLSLSILTHILSLCPFAFPGADLDCSLADDWELEMPNAECVNASAWGHIASQPPRKNSHESPLQSQSMASDHLHGNAERLSSESLFLNLCHTQGILPPQGLRTT